MKCPICSSKTEIKINNVRSYYSIEEFQIRKCNNCDLSFTKVNNKKFDQKKLYKNIYDYSVHESTKSEILWRIEYTFSKVSKNFNIDFTHMALKFCEIQPFVTSVIIGATTMEQLKTNIESVNVTLNNDLINKINEIQKKYPNPCP